MGPCIMTAKTPRKDGYVLRGKPKRYQHRLAWEAHFGPIPQGLVIDHLCRNRACCNPLHMEVVTRGENVRRGHRWLIKPTHCKNGHPFDKRYGRQQVCSICARERWFRWHSVQTVHAGLKAFTAAQRVR